MPTKEVTVPTLGSVLLVKRKGSRSIRLSLASSGQIRISMPPWVPYQAGLQFAHSKADWIAAQRAQARTAPLQSGQAIGKAHRLFFTAVPTASTTSTRLKTNLAIVSYPLSGDPTAAAVQKAARQVAIRALRAEAAHLLPQRVAALAATHGFSYKSVQIKQLKRRWGSCNQDKEIVLNLFLMQLPWELIDYVIVHELTHTEYLHHGEDFWAELTRHIPGARQLRKQIRDYNTDIITPAC